MSITSVVGFIPVVSCLCLLLPTAAKAQPLEWPVSEGGNGHFYQLVIDSPNKSWLEDHLSSLTLGFNGWPGHLATITSAVENAWIMTHLFDPNLPSDSVVYLGGWNDGFVGAPECLVRLDNPCAPLGDWHWITGETWNYAAWAYGEPNIEVESGRTIEFALSYLYHWAGSLGFNNLTFEYAMTRRTVAHVVEYDGLPASDLPPLNHPIPVEADTWGRVKALYR